MNIHWDKKLKTIGQIAIADYISNGHDLINAMIDIISKNDLLTASFTSKDLDSGFVIYEIRREQSFNHYQIILLRGVRSGDAMPLLLDEVIQR